MRGIQKGSIWIVSAGLTQVGLQALYLPSLRLKKEPRISDRDINGLTDGGSYTSGRILEGHPTTCSRSQAGHSSNSHCKWWGWGVWVVEGIDIRLVGLISYQGKPVKGHVMTFTAPLINYYCRISFGLTIRIITIGGRGKYMCIYIRPYV